MWRLSTRAKIAGENNCLRLLHLRRPAGEVAVISPDTVQDEVRRDVYYIGCTFALSATIWKININSSSDISRHGGDGRYPHRQKKRADYLLKPFNKAQEALRER